MARVVNAGPNAGSVVMVAGGPDKGVRFASIEGGAMLSEEVSDEVAAAFCAVHHSYTAWVDPAVAEAKAKADAEAAEAEKARADEPDQKQSRAKQPKET